VPQCLLKNSMVHKIQASLSVVFGQNLIKTEYVALDAEKKSCLAEKTWETAHVF